ncbi:MAG TPA: Ig-like domain-containing protein [Longilinea sp.]|nr:Ig-like domain-containing protein [Longilinea sp.]
MQTKKTLLVGIVFVILLASCQPLAEAVQPPSVEAQSLPIVAINAPTNGLSFAEAPVSLQVTASDTAALTVVELSANGVVVANLTLTGATTNVDANLTWAPTTAGEYALSVRAQNSDGLWSDPSTVNVTYTPVVVEQAAAVVPAADTVQASAPSTTVNTGDENLANMYNWSVSPASVFSAPTCGPTTITPSIYVHDDDGINNVIAYVRLVESRGSQITSWVPMHLGNQGGDLYSSSFEPIFSGGWTDWYASHLAAGGTGWYAVVQVYFSTQDLLGNVTHTIVNEVTTIIPCP